MNFYKIITDTLGNIVNGTMTGDELTEFKSYIDEHGWPTSYPKESTIRAIKYMIKEELPSDPVTAFTDLITGTTRKPAKLTEVQKAVLKEFNRVISRARRSKCEHKNLGISAFFYGGCFSPIRHMPELICKDCGLNVTLRTDIPIEGYKKDFGIVITDPALKELDVWAKNLKPSEIRSSNDILRDPIGIYNASVHWDKPIPLTIVNVKKLNSRSGS